MPPRLQWDSSFATIICDDLSPEFITTELIEALMLCLLQARSSGDLSYHSRQPARAYHIDASLPWELLGPLHLPLTSRTQSRSHRLHPSAAVGSEVRVLSALPSP